MSLVLGTDRIVGAPQHACIAMNAFQILRRMLPRLQRHLLALSGDARRFLLLLLLCALAMAVSMLAGPVGALQDSAAPHSLSPPAHTVLAPAPHAG